MGNSIAGEFIAPEPLELGGSESHREVASEVSVEVTFRVDPLVGVVGVSGGARLGNDNAIAGGDDATGPFVLAQDGPVVAGFAREPFGGDHLPVDKGAEQDEIEGEEAKPKLTDDFVHRFGM